MLIELNISAGRGKGNSVITGWRAILYWPH